jgi:hypothetical protein
MASLPPVNTIKTEDFPGEKWAEKLLWPINRFMQAIYGALNKNLTFHENMRAITKEVIFTNSAANLPIKFSWPLPVRPTDLWVTAVSPVGSSSNPTGAVWAQWTFDGTQVFVTQVTGLVADNKYNLRFVVASN